MFSMLNKSLQPLSILKRCAWLASLVMCILPYYASAQRVTHATLKYHELTNNHAEMSMKYTYERSPQAVVQQDGRGVNQLEIAANAHHILDAHSKTWGTVSYTNACTWDVQGTETSDYHLVAPYIMSDTIGGNIKSERYYFNAGYAWHSKRWTVGGALSYRALLAYRDRDPRPKNRVGHLYADISAAYALTNRHLLSVHLGGQKYKQSSSLEFKNPHKVVKEYHETGLGTVYARFTGDKTNNDIQGQAYQTSLALYPQQLSGFGAQIDWGTMQLEKKLNGFNELPLTDLEINSYKLLAYFKRVNTHNKWRVQTLANVLARRGTENIFGTDATTTFEKISERQYYDQNVYVLSVQGLYEWDYNKKQRYSILAECTWEDNSQKHKKEGYQLDYTWLNTNMAVSAHWPLKKSCLHLSATGKMQWGMDSNFGMPRTVERKYFIKNYETASKSQLRLSTHIRYDSPWSIGTKQVFLVGDYQYGHFAQSLQTHKGSVGFGIIL